MAIELVQSTASQEIPLGYFVDSTDGNTEETGLTIANTDIKLWKAGATALANKNSGGGTHISNGIYYCVLDATDTDTLGPLVVFVHVSGALPVRVECVVRASTGIPVNVTHFGGTAGTFSGGRPEVNTTHAAGTAWGSGAITAASIAADAITAAKIADGAIDAGAIASDAITAAKIATGAISAAKFAAGAIDAAAIADAAIDAATFAAGAINAAAIAADAITDAKVASDVTIASVTGAVGSVTGNVGGNVTGSVGSVATGGITAASFAANAITAAKLDPDVTTELQAGLATQASVDTIDGIVDAILVDTAEIGAAGAGLTVLATQASVNTIDGIVDAILVDTAEIGAAGAGLTVLATAANLATVDTVVDAIKVTTDKLDDTLEDDGGTYRFTTNALEQAPTGGSAPTVGQIADAVWDEALAGHAGAGSAGEALSAAGTAGDPWTTALPGAYGSGTAGFIVGTNINATISSRATQTSVDTVDGIVDSILVDTAEIGAAGAGLTVLATQASVNTIDDFLDTEVAAILADTNELQTDWANGGRLDVILDARASQSSVDTIDGIVDAILVDTAVIGALGAGLTAVPWNAAWDAEVQSEVQDAIEANHLDHLLAATYDPASKPGAADALLNELVENDGGVSRYTANALEQAPSGSGASAADIADAVWDEPIAGHLGAGSTGDSLDNATAAGNPWAAVIEGSLTAEDILRILAGVAAGKTTITLGGSGAATVTFRDITDAGDIVQASMQGSERQAVTVTP